jgi:iron complex outermembrane receptor protein
MHQLNLLAFFPRKQCCTLEVYSVKTYSEKTNFEGLIMKVKLNKFMRGFIAAGFTTSTCFGIPSLTLAQDQVTEEVVVTGSRIRGLISDAPRPITSLAIEDLQLSGVDSVTDALRESSYNTLGSYTQQSGSSFAGVALVSLKGIGSDRTAVLVNGRRVPGNPWTGTSAVDMNTMPLAAIDRIEILTDSASAVYGADAIGGAINIIMKDNWTGAEVALGGARPTRDSANTGAA